jgi:hypothetical protein
MPVLVTVANITLKSFSLDAEQIRVISNDGISFPVIPLIQAEQGAGGADRLAAALPDLNPVQAQPPSPPESPGSMMVDFCFGPLKRLSPEGAQFGAGWLMFICPTFAIAVLVSMAIPKTNKPAPIPAHNLNADLLPNGDLPPGRDIRGYIFLRPGHYTAVEVPIIYSDSGFTTTIVQQWESKPGDQR